MSALTYARNRLFFLVKNDILFKEVQKIEFRKAKTSFRVYYGKPNSGSLFDYKVQKGGKVVLVFPAIDDGETGPEPSGELDNYLLKAFTQRVTSAGVSLDSAPVLRTIKGGQPGGAA